MNSKLETELKVGVFVTIGVILLMVAILLLGGADSFFTRHSDYTTHLRTAEGLIPGAKVVLAGINVGTVSDVSIGAEKGDVQIRMTVQRKFGDWIRKDSEVEVMTQGVLGDRYVGITTGTPTEPAVAEGSEIPARPTHGIAEMLPKADQLMVSLNSMATSLDRILKRLDDETSKGAFFSHMASTSRNLDAMSSKLSSELDGIQIKRASAALTAILEKVNNGTGTLGAIINDPSLYDDTRALLGGANRNRIIRNLVRKTVDDGEEAKSNEKK